MKLNGKSLWSAREHREREKEVPMSDAQYSQTDGWQDFFTEFKRYAFETIPSHIPTVDNKDTEQFFSLFKRHYEPFVRSGGTIDVWDVVGVGMDEVRNCAVLGWLLDCYGSHGQGTAFLRWFLETVHLEPLKAGCRERFPQAAHIHAPYRTILENAYDQRNVEGKTPDSRVDIVIENNAFLLFIEAKIQAGETGNQLERYTGILHSRAGGRRYGMVFLTPTGRSAQDESISGVACLGWKQLAETFETRTQNISSGMVSPQQPLWAMLVQQFCRHIRTF
jgi:hypothetical protein